MSYTKTQNPLQNIVKKPKRLETRLIIWVTGLCVLQAVLFGGLVYRITAQSLHDHIGDKALAVATSIASSDDVVKALKNPSNLVAINQEIENLRQLTGADFIVIGDKIRTEVSTPNTGSDKVIRIVDSSIKDITEANQIANQTLKIHTDPSRKITLTLDKKGLELMEAGDIVTLNFPNHNIPKDDYQVFEIENVLGGVMKLTVGTFNKTIAERLTEISLQQAKANISNMSKDAMIVSAGLSLSDNLNINSLGVSYEITSTVMANPNLGFDDTVGFTETVNFDTQTTLKSDYDDAIIRNRGKKYYSEFLRE